MAFDLRRFLRNAAESKVLSFFVAVGATCLGLAVPTMPYSLVPWVGASLLLFWVVMALHVIHDFDLYNPEGRASGRRRVLLTLAITALILPNGLKAVSEMIQKTGARERRVAVTRWLPRAYSLQVTSYRLMSLPDSERTQSATDSLMFAAKSWADSVKGDLDKREDMIAGNQFAFASNSDGSPTFLSMEHDDPYTVSMYVGARIQWLADYASKIQR